MTQRKPLPLGIEDFKKLIEDGYAYVDKSLLIHELITTRAQAVLFPRMRRFGKTLAMSMLRYFFECEYPHKAPQEHPEGAPVSVNAHLFEGLAVSKHPETMAHQGKYPVIFMTLKGVEAESFEAALPLLHKKIAKEFQRHSYLLDSPALLDVERQQFATVYYNQPSDTLYTTSLEDLTGYLSRHHGQSVVILIDEYDAPVHHAYKNKYYNEMMSFMRPWLSNGYKTNPALQCGVLTGVLRVAKESVFSGLNNVIPYTVFETGYSDKFGFLEQEVAALLDEYGLSKELTGLRRWYNGYRIGHTTGFYNPWSVLRCIADKCRDARCDFQSYWAGTGGDGLLDQVIEKGPGMIKADLEVLLGGGTIEKVIDDRLVFPDLMHDDTAVWTLLLFSGYLTLAAPSSPRRPTRLCFPNDEVREVFTTMVQKWYTTGRDEVREQYCQMLDAVATGDVAAFERILQQFMMHSVSFLDRVPEREWLYHIVLLAMLVGLTGSHQVRSNREAGLGRYDILVQPNNKKAPGMVVELKHVEKPEELEAAAVAALEQIATRRYAEELRGAGIERIIEVGVGFCGKQVVVRHRSTACK